MALNQNTHCLVLREIEKHYSLNKHVATYTKNNEKTDEIWHLKVLLTCWIKQDKNVELYIS